MPKVYKLEVTKRDGIGKKAVKNLRREKKIPGIYYSYDSSDSTPFEMEETEIHNILKSESSVFSISVGGEEKNVIFKSVQYHPVTDSILHIDLYGVDMSKKITVKVSINLIGDAIGVKNEGGILSQALNEIEVACLPGNIPGQIDVDVSGLNIGDAITAGEIDLDDTLDLVTTEDVAIASVTHMQAEVVAEVEEDELEGEEGAEDAEGEEGTDDKSEEGTEESSSNDSSDGGS